MRSTKVLRRTLWTTVAVMLAMAADGFLVEPGRLEIVRAQIQLPMQRSGALKMAVLTDLHVGSPHNGIDNLKRVVALTNAQQPDVVCILGDLVIQGVRGGHFVPPEEIARELSTLQSRYGAFAVLGNHDVWLDSTRVVRALEGNRIIVIDDEAVRLETSAGPLWLVGVGDFMTGRSNVARSLSHVTDDAPAIALTHNPDVFPYVPKRVALTLAGHTHGGQVNLLGWRPIVPSIFGQRYAAGYVNEGGRQMYVSTGIGTSIIPVRFGVPPSLTMIILNDKGRT